MTQQSILPLGFVITLNASEECFRLDVRFQSIRTCGILGMLLLNMPLHICIDVRLKPAAVANLNQSNCFLANPFRKIFHPFQKQPPAGFCTTDGLVISPSHINHKVILPRPSFCLQFILHIARNPIKSISNTLANPRIRILRILRRPNSPLLCQPQQNRPMRFVLSQSIKASITNRANKRMLRTAQLLVYDPFRTVSLLGMRLHLLQTGPHLRTPPDAAPVALWRRWRRRRFHWRNHRYRSFYDFYWFWLWWF